ncbi:hypothetical protein P12x_000300 [Tundrisphaera lichenicola]|uniref:hypothetical protein n=1 Tax=Tundrisphaera lichenicola TaxID=2029860 RepID=UPI003EBEC0A8
MTDRSTKRWTIGRGMGLIAGLAVVWALVTTPDTGRFIGAVLLPLTLMILGPILVIQHILDGSTGVRCPYCSAPSLERRSLSSFGSRFYLCPSCGVRCKRGALGTWQDASGPEHEERYRKKPNDDPWSAPPGLEDEDLTYSKTHGNLVRNKRLRRPENPNGPGLE